MIPAFRPISSQSRELQRLQDSLRKLFNALLSKQVIDGRLISGVAITSGAALEVNHGLGHAPRGWVVAGRNANATVWETASDTPNATLVLNASADVTINLWLF